MFSIIGKNHIKKN